MIFTIKNKDIVDYNDCTQSSFPKYTSQIMNLANQNAQGTRPSVIGQLSELFSEFMNSSEEKSVTAWQEWYANKYPDAIENATDRIYEQVMNLKDAIELVDRELIEEWVRDLIIVKSFNGLYVQKAILAFLAKQSGETYRLANVEEEAQGIDGYVGDVAYSVKPLTYKSTMQRLQETIDVKMIYYTKTKAGLKIEVEN